MKLPDFLFEAPYGDIRLVGHRIGLYHVVAGHKNGMSAAALHEEYPTLSLDLINQVLDFYLDNREEVDAYVAQVRADLDHMEATMPRRIDWDAIRLKFEAMQRAKAQTGQ
jgi:uncharacterized protein (DUF433 family)